MPVGSIFDNYGFSTPAPIKPEEIFTEADYLSAAVNKNVASSYTFSDIDIGEPNAKRLVVIAVGSASRSSSGVLLSSATIGGVSATIIQTGGASYYQRSAIIYAAVPTGTLADVVLNFASGIFGCGMAIYRLIADPTGVKTPSFSSSGSTSTLNYSTTVSAEKDDFIITAFAKGNVIENWSGSTQNAQVQMESTYTARLVGASILAPSTGNKTIRADSQYPGAGVMTTVPITVEKTTIPGGERGIKSLQRVYLNLVPDLKPDLKVVQDGLVLHLDAGDTNSYPGTGTTWYDLSGNNLHFNMVGSPAFTSGYFYNFSSTNYFDCGNSNWTSIIPTGDQPRTICVFARRETGSILEHAVHYGTATTNQSYGLAIRTSDGAITDHRWYGSNYGPIVATGNDVFLSTRYNTTTYPGARFQINSSFTTDTDDTVNLNTTTTHFRVGSRVGAATETWAGRIYAVLIYDRDLTDEELLQNFQVYITS